MKWRLVIIFLSLSLLFPGVGLTSRPVKTDGSHSPDKTLNRLATLIRENFDRYQLHNTYAVMGEPLFSPVLLHRFYNPREFLPAWVDENGIGSDGIELLTALRLAYREGLRPQDYHLDILDRLLKDLDSNGGNSPSSSLLVQLELLFTDSFLTYGSHLLAGRINPTAVSSDWIANRRDANLADVLEKAFKSNNVREMLQSLRPPQPLYEKLREALARYSTFEKNEDWPIIDEGPPLKKGDKDPRVIPLRRRLFLEGDERRRMEPTEELDSGVERALKRFQGRYGLEMDGIFGIEVQKAMQVPMAARTTALRLNLERCRWLPDDLGKRHIMVNVADYSLEVIEKNRVVMDMKVIVGKPYRKTPVFSSTITYMVINPYWHVPRKIAIKDILPKIQEDPLYISNMGFKMYESGLESASQLPPQKIDWSKVDPSNFSFNFKQDPGPQNALGKIKFMFPNSFGVYLHDTPSKRLFNESSREFSSGCVRIEKPIELAEYLVQAKGEGSLNYLKNALKNSGEIYINLDNPMPIHIMYWTAWVDSRGRVQFRDDIYGRDQSLLEALNRDLVYYEKSDWVPNP